MMSRLLDAQGMPRDRALWLVMASVVASQLLAFWVVCNQQVLRAQERHAQARQAVQACGGQPGCGTRTADARGLQDGAVSH